jgi:hypothetical protein
MLSLTPQRVRSSAHGAKQMFGVEPCAALGRAMPARRDLAQLGRGTSLAQVISSDVSDASAIPHKTDDLDAGGPIFHGRMRLRALSCVNMVVGSSPLGRIEIPANYGIWVDIRIRLFGSGCPPPSHRSHARPGRPSSAPTRDRDTPACARDAGGVPTGDSDACFSSAAGAWQPPMRAPAFGEEQVAWICDLSDLPLPCGKRVSGRCGSERASHAGSGSPRPAVGRGLALRRTGARRRRAERERRRA